jgi:3-oxoacyl-[acyl-carrier protein] reductase
MNRLENKVAIVTGGGTGIGRGVARALASEGARVVVCGRRRDRLEQTVEAIRQAGGSALAVQADVSDVHDVDRLVTTTMETYGKIDILINNAGIADGGELHNLDPETWDRVMETNLRGPFLTMRRVLPVMRLQGSGHIINISSESGLEYYRGDTVYGVSKHALNDLGEFVQRENQELNIRVNTICPGMVVTEMTEDSPGLDHSKCLYPEDIADLVIWLLTRRPNIKIGTPILIQTMQNPWE